MSEFSNVSILGIRHHGPGSARSVCRALEDLRPDILLIEGPPDAEDVLALAAHESMTPPVALLVYVPTEPHRAVYYPFADFSPEWQAIRYGLSNKIPVRFMDLPQSVSLAAKEPEVAASAADGEPGIHQDPLRWAAEAAGYGDSERWWDHFVEQRRDAGAVFDAVMELMIALRETALNDNAYGPDEAEPRREAHMRQMIRAAHRDGFQRIAAVCGAWHAPALRNMPEESRDAELLNGLARVKVSATWVPWTYGRLTYWSGYGAGIESPGYYHHVWAAPRDVTSRWMISAARLLREQDLDTSVASVIEAVRLAEALAAMRDRPLPGLPELNEAIRAVFCFGSELPMKLISEKLIVGERLGVIPDETPMLPLQRDLQQSQKRLRLPAEASVRDLDLDLRKPNDLERSYFLRRLGLLGIHWGAIRESSGKGTFHEMWRLQWRPELAVGVIEANIWGNTVSAASTARVLDLAADENVLPVLTALVQGTLMADLPDAIGQLMERLQNVAALTSDTGHLMGALPPLASVMRYGNVRRTDTTAVSQVVDGLVARICVGLPAACSALNDEAADQMHQKLVEVDHSIAMLQNEEYLAQWRSVLQHVANQPSLHGLVSGRCCRILFDQGAIDAAETGVLMSGALSRAAEPAEAAAWIEGFLRGSGQVLLHSDSFWRILDDWVSSLAMDAFEHLLPLLRRTFSEFQPAERRQMGERVKRGAQGASVSAGGLSEASAIDTTRADQVLPLVMKLLGIK